MNFIYAIKNTSVLSGAVLEKTGLGRVFDEPGKVQTTTSTEGPGGKPCLLCGNVPPRSLRFKPDEQKWTDGNDGQYYVGFYVDDPPKPAGLARKNQLAGHEIELGDGNKWLIPVARKFAEGSVLPVALGIGANGQIITDELEEFAGFSGRAEKYYRDFLKWLGDIEGCNETDTAFRIKLALEALTTNYQLGCEEPFAMKLITSKNLTAILEAIIDVPTIVEVTRQAAEDKKKECPAGIQGG